MHKAVTNCPLQISEQIEKIYDFWEFFNCVNDDAAADTLVCISEAHLTVLVLDLTAMRLKNFRKDIDITDEQLYERCLREDVVSIEVCFVGFWCDVCSNLMCLQKLNRRQFSLTHDVKVKT